MPDEDARIQSLKSQLQTASSYLKKLAQDNQKLESEVERLSAANKDDNDKSQKTIDDLRKQLDILKVDKESADKKIHDIEQAKSSDGDQNIKAENDGLKAKIKELENELENKKNDRAQEKDQSSKVDRKLQEKTTTLIRFVAEKCNIDLSKSELKATDLDKLKKQVEIDFETLSKLGSEKEKSKKTNDELQTKVNSLNARLGDFENQFTMLSKQLKGDSGDIKLITKVLQGLAAAMSLKGVPEKLTSTLNRTQSSIAGIIEERDQLKTVASELEKKDSKVKELTEKLRSSAEENESLEKEYNMLLDKLGKMKDALSAKMSGESSELKILREENADLVSKLESAQSSLSTIRQSLETANNQIEELQAYSEQEIGRLEEQVGDMEIRTSTLQQERDQLEDQAEMLRNDLNESYNSVAKWEEEREMHSQTIQNLQSALEQLQQKQDLEMSMTVDKITLDLESSKKMVEEWKQKANAFEKEMNRLKTMEETFYKSKKQADGQSAEVGRLRHEAVILKEHLNESMRRLREESNDFNLDKRVITNLVVTFLALPYGDSKRYEILQLMSSILQFSEEQQQKVGLVRKAGKPIPNRGKVQTSNDVDYDNIETKESFSDMWISFLLRESSSAANKQETKPES